MSLKTHMTDHTKYPIESNASWECYSTFSGANHFHVFVFVVNITHLPGTLTCFSQLPLDTEGLAHEISRSAYYSLCSNLMMVYCFVHMYRKVSFTRADQKVLSLKAVITNK